MAKNLVVNNPQPVAKEKDASLAPEMMAASSNYVMGAAYDAPLKVNAARARQEHMGNMPMKGDGQF